MRELLSILHPADYRFMAGILESPFNLTDDTRLEQLTAALESADTPENRSALEAHFEKELRYLGSSDLMYAFRNMTGGEGGVQFHEIVRDAAATLKVDAPDLATDREMVEQVATDHATVAFAKLPREAQQQMLEDLGVDREKARAFLARSAGVFALPMLIQAFNVIVVQGLIQTVIFGTIARIIGSQLAARLFSFLAARLPWWVGWIGPAAWTLSLGWTAIDLQGPARRKTVPVVLYLGLCSLRERTAQPSDVLPRDA
jgi:uncharacterized protein YaaW (UPF0174 family)